MVKFMVYAYFLAAAIAPVLVQGIKIAFVGDTGMEGRSNETNIGLNLACAGIDCASVLRFSRSMFLF